MSRQAQSIKLARFDQSNSKQYYSRLLKMIAEMDTDSGWSPDFPPTVQQLCHYRYYLVLDRKSANLLGYVSFSLAKPLAFLDNIFVASEYRGKGIGRQALNKTLCLLESRKRYSAAFIMYYYGNSVAENLYHSAGFKPVSQAIFNKIRRSGDTVINDDSLRLIILTKGLYKTYREQLHNLYGKMTSQYMQYQDFLFSKYCTKYKKERTLLVVDKTGTVVGVISYVKDGQFLFLWNLVANTDSQASAILTRVINGAEFASCKAYFIMSLVGEHQPHYSVLSQFGSIWTEQAIKYF